jgi:formylglycine-generating enzyme
MKTTNFSNSFTVVLTLTAVVALSATGDPTHADTFGSGANTFNIVFTTIGNPGNAADTTGSPNPAGSVGNTYRIGTYETSEQMIDKANALGGLGITKDARGADKPATSISWNEAARFVNWLNTSTGSTPAYKFDFQPGQGGYSANANIQLWTPSDAGYNPNNLYRNSLAHYVLPSVNEWYKAAYYNPTSGVYYDYPTGSNSVPDGIDVPNDPNFAAVFNDGNPNPDPNDITNVGALSPYGTAGQGGNVYEWDETSDPPNSPGSFPRGLRGGFWAGGFGNLDATIRSAVSPTIESNQFGFRVASVSPLLGDFNGNSTVDAADYVVWRKTNGPPTDYNLWRSNFGKTAGGGPGAGSGATGSASAVPEPATLVMLSMAILGICCRRRAIVS